MPTEPSKAEPPNRKRRRFQFRLPTLLIGVTLQAVFVGSITWLVEDRQPLTRERDEARRAAEWNYRAAIEEQSKTMTAKSAAQEAGDRVRSLEIQNAIANERPGINNLIERRDMTRIPAK
jgi:hypothetical protein